MRAHGRGRAREQRLPAALRGRGRRARRGGARARRPARALRHGRVRDGDARPRPDRARGRAARAGESASESGYTPPPLRAPDGGLSPRAAGPHARTRRAVPFGAAGRDAAVHLFDVRHGVTDVRGADGARRDAARISSSCGTRRAARRRARAARVCPDASHRSAAPACSRAQVRRERRRVEPAAARRAHGARRGAPADHAWIFAGAREREDDAAAADGSGAADGGGGEEAACWYDRAAELGSAHAKTRLGGELFVTGYEGSALSCWEDADARARGRAARARRDARAASPASRATTTPRACGRPSPARRQRGRARAPASSASERRVVSSERGRGVRSRDAAPHHTGPFGPRPAPARDHPTSALCVWLWFRSRTGGVARARARARAHPTPRARPTSPSAHLPRARPVAAANPPHPRRPPRARARRAIHRQAHPRGHLTHPHPVRARHLPPPPTHTQIRQAAGT